MNVDDEGLLGDPGNFGGGFGQPLDKFLFLSGVISPPTSKTINGMIASFCPCRVLRTRYQVPGPDTRHRIQGEINREYLSLVHCPFYLVTCYCLLVTFQLPV